VTQQGGGPLKNANGGKRGGDKGRGDRTRDLPGLESLRWKGTQKVRKRKKGGGKGRSDKVGGTGGPDVIFEPGWERGNIGGAIAERNHQKKLRKGLLGASNYPQTRAAMEVTKKAGWNTGLIHFWRQAKLFGITGKKTQGGKKKARKILAILEAQSCWYRTRHWRASQEKE